MDNFGIKVLPDIVNALIMTSVLSAGNNLVFSGARILHGMAMEGKAPSFFAKCSKTGLPYFAVIATLAFCLLALLQVSNGSAKVLGWLVDLITVSYLLNYVGTCITYLHFHASLKHQGVDRNTLPYKGYLQPFAGWYALFGTTVMTFITGYSIFIRGNWDITSFFLTYSLVGGFLVAIVFWKLVRGTTYVRPGTADLQLGSLKTDIDIYEELYVPPQKGKWVGFLDRIFE